MGTIAYVYLSSEASKEGMRQFWRMFLIFNSMKVGWLEGGKFIIGLDGWFLKGGLVDRQLLKLMKIIKCT